ncbi:DUF2135 domain-containing protein [Paraburkholderia sediminicola]
MTTNVQAAGADGDGGALADLTGAFGGWRHSGLTNEGEHFVAAYPRPPVDRGAQRYRTLIEGRLKHIDKHARKPPTLVVNGNPTPLYTDDEGAFARPWAFGAGPGIFSSAAPEHGTWLFFLNYWGNFDSTGYYFDAAAHERDVITATLTLVFNENTPNERRETMVVPLRKIGDLQLVKSERL